MQYSIAKIIKKGYNNHIWKIYIIGVIKMEQELLSQIFTLKNILIYLLFINIFAFLIMWYDKYEAKIGQWRVSEGFLFLLVFLRWWNRWNSWNVYI